MNYNKILYELLGITDYQNTSNIKRSYFRLGLLYHPDKVIFLTLVIKLFRKLEMGCFW